MSDKGPLAAVVAAFTTEEGASNALKALKGADRDTLHVDEAAVVVRDSDGKLKIDESHHVAKGAVLGGIAGGVVGVIAGPVGWVALGGVAVGALAQRLRDSGFPDARLKEIGEGLKPGTSTLIAIVELRWVAEVEKELRAEAADVVTEAVGEQVATELDESTTGAGWSSATATSPVPPPLI
jgi:uncharacterized membrane protein